MNQLTKVFEGNDIRLVNNEEVVWFVLSDVCSVLGLTNATMAASRLDDDEVTKFNLGSRQGETLLVNEFGLYSLVMSSRKKEAKSFKRWVTHEVIPSIRKKGFYQIEPKNELELIEMTAREMIKTNERIDSLEDKVEKQMTINYGQQQAICNAKNKRVEKLWGEIDWEGTFYDTKRKVHAKAWTDLKNAFAVASYRDIKPHEFDEAIAFVKSWRPALV